MEHKGNKDKEIGMMMADIANMKEIQKDTSNDVKALRVEVQGFIIAANKTYATKKELDDMKTSNSWLGHNWFGVLVVLALAAKTVLENINLIIG